ncbi:MAG: MATE family efflux transporter [Clostridia bacterium]
MVKENKLGSMPIKKLVVSMALPIAFSMLIQALYNIVDGIFVSMISEDAFTAVSLAFPIQNLIIAVGTGTGVGVNAMLSRSLGQKNFDKANKVATHGLLLSFLSMLAFVLFGFFGTKLFFGVQVAAGSDIYNYGVEYTQICCIFSFGVFGQLMFEKLMQATGKTVLSMTTQLVGAITNIVLDPLLILGIGFFPELGVKGAAVATVTGQILGCIVGLILNHHYNHDIKLQIKGFKADMRLIGEIYRIGVPAILMLAIGSVMTFLMNKILLVFSTTAAAVFGIYFKVQSFFFMPVYGLNNACIPIISYNFGAANKERMNEALNFTIKLACAIMAVGTFVMLAFPKIILKMFAASDDMLVIGVPALRTICFIFVIAGYCIIAGGAFQAVGKSMFSMIVSFTRQLVVLIPVAYLLSLTGEVQNVWYAFIIAEFASFVATYIFLRHVKKNIFAKVGSHEQA